MSTFHTGELIAQTRAGLRAEADRVSALIGSEIPPLAQGFLADQPLIVVGAVDAGGRLWATMLTGLPGFLTVTGPATVEIAAAPAPGDPLHGVLASETRVGLLAIDLETRRRVRINGTSHPVAGGLRIDVGQVYPNCPKYIQQRRPRWAPAEPGAARVSAALTVEDSSAIDLADSFFVATAGPDGHADASHRGGNPGFLRAVSPTHLRWPDYVGNSMFNTFGNLEVNPRAGLLVPDWSTGALTHLTGTAVVDWNPDHAAAVPGAQRLVDFTIERGVRSAGGGARRGGHPHPPRATPPPPRAGGPTP